MHEYSTNGGLKCSIPREGGKTITKIKRDFNKSISINEKGGSYMAESGKSKNEISPPFYNVTRPFPVTAPTELELRAALTPGLTHEGEPSCSGQ